MEIKNKNPRLTFCGIMTAVSAVLAVLMNFLPFNTVFLLVIMSLVICVVVQKTGTLYALCTAAATSVVMLLVTWRYATVAEYVLLFGTYPAVKFIIEDKIKDAKKEKILKTVYFCFISVLFMLAAVYLFGGVNFFGEWFSKSVLTPYVLIVVTAALAWVYDYILTWVIYVYNRRFGTKF